MATMKIKESLESTPLPTSKRAPRLSMVREWIPDDDEQEKEDTIFDSNDEEILTTYNEFLSNIAVIAPEAAEELFEAIHPPREEPLSGELVDVSFGTRKLKLDSGEQLTMPNVVRTVTRLTMIFKYLEFCKEQNFDPLSRSTLYRILDAREASKRKALQGLDNIASI
ncbi:Hypothetical predicted protein [Paramuricea clavata]|uniref:Uncharacterized protein n=1 Tax=Paramuricea clavata TaxID=317549 RepID=A0A6S7I4H8_PARCT|nr:Hypothetical predicted protein [Paramuricea clavata]